jgi:hypothetical protein
MVINTNLRAQQAHKQVQANQLEEILNIYQVHVTVEATLQNESKSFGQLLDCLELKSHVVHSRLLVVLQD